MDCELCLFLSLCILELPLKEFLHPTFLALLAFAINSSCLLSVVLAKRGWEDQVLIWAVGWEVQSQ